MSHVILYLVRHGAIKSGAEKAFIGQIDAPLSEDGVKQAWALREWLKGVRFSSVISSDLQRSQRTARIITRRPADSIEVMQDLREISLGEWEGLTFEEIKERLPEEYAARGHDIENWRPSRGESFADCNARVMTALDGIVAGSDGNVLLAGHAGVNRLILCSVLGIPVRNLHSIGQDYGCVNIIEVLPERKRVRLLNYVPGRSLEQIRSLSVAAQGAFWREVSA